MLIHKFTSDVGRPLPVRADLKLGYDHSNEHYPLRSGMISQGRDAC